MQALEGLENAKPSRQRFWDRHASPISILILGSLLLASVLGLTGGQPSPPRTADFGENTDELLAGIGCDAAEIARLRAAGVVA